jgi:large conductance mechanosensitive channel
VAAHEEEREVLTTQEPTPAQKHRKEVVIVVPEVKAPNFLQGFVDFIREQGVVGVAVGLVLGLASNSLINSLVSNILNPFIGVVTGGISLDSKTACIRRVNGICTTQLKYGKFVSDFISFLVLILTVYVIVKSLKLEKLKKKEI